MPADPPIQLPLRDDHPYVLSVWAEFGPTIPVPELLIKTYFGWLTQHVDDPFRTSLRSWSLDRDFNLEVMQAGTLPAPPLQVLRGKGHGPDEERRLGAATHEIVITARDGRKQPKLALWSVVGAARAFAQAYDGVILDRDVPRLLPINTYGNRLAPELYAPDHVTVVVDHSHQDRTDMRVYGTAKFQLPLLVAPGVSRKLQSSLGVIMLALTQVLVHRARRRLNEGHQSLAIAPEFNLSLDHEALKRVDWNIDSLSGARRAAEVRLELVTDASGTALRLAKPRQAPGTWLSWLETLVNDTLGAPLEQIGIKAQTDALKVAHEKAMAELPRIKARYASGLSFGQRLYVKRAYPTKSDGPEYLWIQVSSWFEGLVRGTLVTAPRKRTDLTVGQTLQLQEEDIFDWMLVMGDGTELGGYSDQLERHLKYT